MKWSIIPRQKKGKKNDLYFDRHFTSEDAARDVFITGCKRLLSPNKWHEVAGKGATFRLVDAQGKPLRRQMRHLDYLRINIPGPGHASGDGYDWVQVAVIDDHRKKSDGEEWLGIQLRACASPIDGDNRAAEHFFKKQASSSFIIHRLGKAATAAYHGRNETINNHTGNLLDNIRNTAIGLGAFAGFSELQWKALIKGFLTDE